MIFESYSQHFEINNLVSHLISTVGGLPARDETLRSSLPGERTTPCSRRQQSLGNAQDGRHMHLDPSQQESAGGQSQVTETNSSCTVWAYRVSYGIKP